MAIQFRRDQIIDSIINSAKLDSGAVSAGKIAAGGVSAANQFGAGVVETAALADLNVTSGKLAANAVTTAKITDANITTAKLAANAVTTAKITDANITTAKIADVNVTTAKLANNAVSPAKAKLDEAWTWTGALPAADSDPSGNNDLTRKSWVLSQIDGSAHDPEFDEFTGDGSETVFALSVQIAATLYKGVKVYRNGQRLRPVASSPADSSEYMVSEISGSTKITLGGAPATGAKLFVDYVK